MSIHCRGAGEDAALPPVLWDPADEYPKSLSLFVIGNRFFLLPLSCGEENGRSTDLSLPVHRHPGLRKKPSGTEWGGGVSSKAVSLH